MKLKDGDEDDEQFIKSGKFCNYIIIYCYIYCVFLVKQLNNQKVKSKNIFCHVIYYSRDILITRPLKRLQLESGEGFLFFT